MECLIYFSSNTIVGNALINKYSKCESARKDTQEKHPLILFATLVVRPIQQHNKIIFNHDARISPCM